MTSNILPKKYFSKFKKPLVAIPNLAKDQVESFKWLIEKGIKEVADEFTVINDTSGKKFKFEFLSFELEEPKMELLSSVLVYDIYSPILVAKSLIAAGFLAYLSEYE